MHYSNFHNFIPAFEVWIHVALDETKEVLYIDF